MIEYFAGTSFWIALIDRRDALPAQAMDWSRRISGRLVTTEAVLLETANTFSKPGWREKAIALINHVKHRDDVEIVPFSDSLWSQD
jgi:predicted nucleic acid-binding protein